jgi:uncharacterized protein
MYWSRDYDPDESLRMQTDITHLPEAKQRELEQITDIIRAQGEVEMVILFGSYARGDWREEKDLKPDRWSGHASDYDILVVVKDPERAADAGYRRTLLEATNKPKFSTHAHPIVHDIDDVNTNLEEGRYFFLDIKREGKLLFDSEMFKLAEPRELTAEERQRMAQADFDYWFDLATRFYRMYELAYEEGDLRNAIFNLNQATESAYKAILMVFTSYCPHEHMLEWLGYEAANFGPVFREIFPTDSQKEQERFELLDRAYIGARYRKDFVVFWGDVEYLAPKVKVLLETAGKICRDEIAKLSTS